MIQNSVEVKSSLFPACQNCSVAKNTGADAILKVLTPDLCYTAPSKKSDFTATITCAFDTGVQVKNSQIVYEADVRADGKSVGEETGPIENCPGLKAPPQKS